MIDGKRIASQIEELPALSLTVVRVFRVLHDERASLGDLEQVLRLDPAMSANLLRIANTAAIGVPRKVGGVRHALALLGANRVYEAVTSVAFAKIIPKFLPGYAMAATDYWRHCAAVAVISERLARVGGGAPPDLTFVAGLLHDLGKLAIGTFLAREGEALVEGLREQPVSFIAAERAALGTDHAEVGQALADRWALPAEIAQVARWHHQPAAGEIPREQSRLVWLVHTANAMAHMLGFGADVGELAREVDPQALAQLGLDDQAAQCVLAECLGPVAEICALLSPAEDSKGFGGRRDGGRRVP